jgi:sugar O-acyltransferase (sialic acid O-acetyltransferase NeuD family)
MKFCIVGTGGAGREAFESLEKILLARGQDALEQVCFMQTDTDSQSEHIMGVPVIPYHDYHPELYQIIVAIGSPKLRKRVVSELPSTARYVTLIDPTAVVSKYASLGKGSIVGAGVVVTCNVDLGAFVQLNLNTTISHDTVAGDFFTTAPTVSVCGNCSIGAGVYLGAGACVRQGITICDGVTIGMGGVVVKDVLEPGVYAGVPVKKIK